MTIIYYKGEVIGFKLNKKAQIEPLLKDIQTIQYLPYFNLVVFKRLSELKIYESVGGTLVCLKSREVEVDPQTFCGEVNRRLLPLSSRELIDLDLLCTKIKPKYFSHFSWFSIGDYMF